MSVRPPLGSKPKQVHRSVTTSQVSSQWGEGGGGPVAHLHRRLRTEREWCEASRGPWDGTTNQTHWHQEVCE